jgi:hypothetical protein
LTILDLIVNEYQDLNPIDQQLVDEMIARGIATFVAGDDDQSIYSFRYGSPSGIQGYSATQERPRTPSPTASVARRRLLTQPTH